MIISITSIGYLSTIFSGSRNHIDFKQIIEILNSVFKHGYSTKGLNSKKASEVENPQKPYVI